MGLRDRLRKFEQWAQNDFLADSESESERSGYLSWRGEWHAAAWGLAAGVLAMVSGQMVVIAATVGWLFSRAGDGKIPGFIPYPGQFRSESAYLLGHLLAGVIVGLGMRVVMGWVGITPPPIDTSLLSQLV